MDMENPVLAAGFGVMLVVVFVSCILLGVVITQASNYYVKYRQDPLRIKLLVAAMLLLDFLSTAFAIAWQFYLLIQHWGDVTALGSLTWLFSLNPLFCGLMGALVHGFFGYRLYIITRSWIWPTLIAAFAFPAFVGAMGTCIASAIVTKVTTSFIGVKGLGVLWLGASVLADISITAVFTFHLRKRRGDFLQTNHVLDRLVLLTVQNGLLTALTATTDLVLSLVYGTPTHTVSFLIPKLYSNSVLSSLNSRHERSESDQFSSGAETGAVTSGQHSKAYRDRQSHQISAGRGRASQIMMINVRTEHTKNSDGLKASAWKSEV